MPINVKVVSQEEFNEWINFAKEEYASVETSQIKLAAK
jgi:heme/copper-type cytochrome/quinol oxidase subunit 2